MYFSALLILSVAFVAVIGQDFGYPGESEEDKRMKNVQVSQTSSILVMRLLRLCCSGYRQDIANVNGLCTHTLPNIISWTHQIFKENVTYIKEPITTKYSKWLRWITLLNNANNAEHKSLFWISNQNSFAKLKLSSNCKCKLILYLI